MKAIQIIVACMLSFFAFTSFAAPKNIIIFGDSLSDAGMNTAAEDVGNNTWVVSSGKVGTPITSLDTVTNTHPLWVNDFLTKILPGDPLYPYRLAQSEKIDPYLYNVDYAYASAETNAHYLNDSDQSQAYPPYVDNLCHNQPGQINPTLSCVPGVLAQINFYLTAVDHRPDPKTIFFLWAGGNDIFNDVSKLMASHKLTTDTDYTLLSKTLLAAVSIDQETATSVELSKPVKNLLLAKDQLIAAGVNPKQIYVINLPDLSKTPAAMNLTKGNKIILGILHVVTTSYNTNLSLALAHNLFNKHNLPAKHIISMYDIFNNMLQNPGKYQLTNTTDSCVVDNDAPVCQGFVFFNDKHPTTTVGEIVAEDLLGDH